MENGEIRGKESTIPGNFLQGSLCKIALGIMELLYEYFFLLMKEMGRSRRRSVIIFHRQL